MVRELHLRLLICGQPRTEEKQDLDKREVEQKVNVLKKDSCFKDYCPKFKHWIKQRGFSLMNYKVLGLQDVLCLPAKKEGRC